MKFRKVFAWLIGAIRAVLQASLTTALPDNTGLTIPDEPPSFGFASVTIDLFRLEVQSEFLEIQCGSPCPGDIIVMQSCQKCGTARTNKTTVSDHLRHGTFLHFKLKAVFHQNASNPTLGTGIPSKASFSNKKLSGNLKISKAIKIFRSPDDFYSIRRDFFIVALKAS